MTSNNNSNIEIRKFILDKCKILKIINIEGGAFTNTTIKTKVLIFQKGNYDNYNQEVEFVEINSNGVNSLGLEKLNSTCQFIISKKEETINYNKDIEIKTLEEVCEFLPKSKKQASYGNKEGEYPFYTSSQSCNKYCDEYDYEDECLIIGTGGTANIKYSSKFCCSTDNIIIKINTGQLVKYIYYYLSSNIEILQKGFLGVGIQHISKEYISNINIPIPSLAKQKQIVDYCESNDKLILQLEREIEENKLIAQQFITSFVKVESETETE